MKKYLIAFLLFAFIIGYAHVLNNYLEEYTYPLISYSE